MFQDVSSGLAIIGFKLASAWSGFHLAWEDSEMRLYGSENCMLGATRRCWCCTLSVVVTMGMDNNRQICLNSLHHTFCPGFQRALSVGLESMSRHSWNQTGLGLKLHHVVEIRSCYLLLSILKAGYSMWLPCYVFLNFQSPRPPLAQVVWEKTSPISSACFGSRWRLSFEAVKLEPAGARCHEWRGPDLHRVDRCGQERDLLLMRSWTLWDPGILFGV